jgi:hypothetical protein
MRIIMAFLSLAPLMWIEPASAQKTYSVSVSRHSGVPELTEGEVKKILADASKLLQKNSGHVDTEDNVKCNVTFTLKDPIRTFASPDTPAIVDKPNLDAVHRVGADVAGVDFHVKVVDKITNFCRFPDQPGGLGFRGCSFPPNFRSIIVVHPKRHIDRADPTGPFLQTFPDRILWAHEFGHLVGLGHRPEEHALMTSCPLDKEFSDVPDAQVQVTRDECTCLLSGPGFGPNGTCGMPGPVRCPRP